MRVMMKMTKAGTKLLEAKRKNTTEIKEIIKEVEHLKVNKMAQLKKNNLRKLKILIKMPLQKPSHLP